MPLWGNRLRDARAEMGLSQEDLADRADVALRQYQRYEAGVNDPAADVIARLSKVLNCTTDYLLGLTDSPTQVISEGDLSPDERELIRAYRQKRAGKLLEAAASIVKENEEARIPTPKPAANR